MHLDMLKAAIYTTLESGNIVPGLVKVLNELLEQKEFFKLIVEHRMLHSYIDALPQPAKESVETMQKAYYAASLMLECAGKALTDEAFNELIGKVQKEVSCLADEASTGVVGSCKHYVGLRGDWGFLFLYTSL